MVSLDALRGFFSTQAYTPSSQGRLPLGGETALTRLQLSLRTCSETGDAAKALASFLQEVAWTQLDDDQRRLFLPRLLLLAIDESLRAQLGIPGSLELNASQRQALLPAVANLSGDWQRYVAWIEQSGKVEQYEKLATQAQQKGDVDTGNRFFVSYLAHLRATGGISPDYRKAQLRYLNTYTAYPDLDPYPLVIHGRDLLQDLQNGQHLHPHVASNLMLAAQRLRETSASCKPGRELAAHMVRELQCLLPQSAPRPAVTPSALPSALQILAAPNTPNSRARPQFALPAPVSSHPQLALEGVEKIQEPQNASSVARLLEPHRGEPVLLTDLVDLPPEIDAFMAGLRNFELLQQLGLSDRQNMTLMLYGPTGTGKTTLACGIASAMPAMPFRICKLTALLDSYVGGTAQAVGRLCKEIEVLTAEQGMSIVLLDEFDSLFSARGQGAGSSREYELAVNTLLDYIEGANCLRNICIIAATNLYSKIDPAVVSRFSLRVAMRAPADPTRLLTKMLNKRPHSVNSYEMHQLAAVAQGLAPRDLRNVLNNDANQISLRWEKDKTVTLKHTYKSIKTALRAYSESR